MKIEGTVAVVVGGAQGMGRAVCEILVEHGAKVVMGDILADVGKKTADELTCLHPKGSIIFQYCDVCKEETLDELMRTAKAKFGDVQISVMVAGVLGEKNWQRTVDVNVKGMIAATNAALRYMGQDNGGKGGVAILMASKSGLRPEFWGPVYAATKHAVVGLCRSWALPENVAVTGVRFNCICPCTVDTPFIEQSKVPGALLHQDKLKDVLKSTDGNFISPRTVAECVLGLISDDAKCGEAVLITSEDQVNIKAPEVPDQ